MIIKEKRGVTPTSLSAAPGGIFSIDMNNYGKAFGLEICRVIVKQIAGTATNFVVSIGDTPDFATSSIHEKYLSTSVASASILDETDLTAFTMTGDTGLLYFNIAPDSGTGNSYAYSIMYRH